jgi:hypothetical protein
VELTRTLGYGPELRETGEMSLDEATAIVERYRSVVTDLVGESSVISDIERGQMFGSKRRMIMTTRKRSIW